MEKIDFQTYKDLEAWKHARRMVTDIYRLTEKFPKEEIFGLTNQLRRSAISVPSNIAEGYGRISTKERQRFLHVARGSLFELETQIIISQDLNFISESEYTSISESITSCKKLINGLLKYIRSASENGSQEPKTKDQSQKR